MLLRKLRKLVPTRIPYDLTEALSSQVTIWPRVYRQVFWLADGHRNTEKIAKLLHKSEQNIEQVLHDLVVSGHVSLHIERTEISMNISLLRQSFDMVAPQKEAFAHSFYERLFDRYPQTRQLFAKTNMKRQESALVATLAMVIAGAERGDNLAPIIQALGKKHVAYGAKEAHYPLVGEVLLETFREYLGASFTPEVQEAWTQAYDLISSQMQVNNGPDIQFSASQDA